MGIKPSGSSDDWTFSAVDKFVSLTEGKRLYVKVCVRTFLVFLDLTMSDPARVKGTKWDTGGSEIRQFEIHTF